MYRSLINRYSEAIILSAVDKKLESETFSDIQTLSKIFLNTPQNLKLLKKIDDFPGAAQEVSNALCDHLKPGLIVTRLIKILSEKRRLELFPSIINRTYMKLKEQKGIILASVVTIRDLDPDEKEMIQTRLNKLTKKQVEIDWQQDKSIYGGFQVNIGDKLIDGTLRTRMEKLQDYLVDPGGNEVP